MSKYDSGTKSIDISCDSDDISKASPIVIFQQSAYINLKLKMVHC